MYRYIEYATSENTTYEHTNKVIFIASYTHEFTFIHSVL